MQDLWWKQPAGSPSRSTSRTSYMSRVSSSQPRDVEFQLFMQQEMVYPPWWTKRGATEWLHSLPDDHLWNWYICGCVLLGVVWTVTQYENIYIDIMDAIYNVSYAIHMFATAYIYFTDMEQNQITFWVALGFLLDVATFAHYAKSSVHYFKLYAYYVRFHRPFRFLWQLNDHNLKGSILGTALKYCYIFMVLRITFAFVWLRVGKTEPTYYIPETNAQNQTDVEKTYDSTEPVADFMTAYYIISKMFIPVGPSIYPNNDVERFVCLLIMITGCLVVTGTAVASLSLIVSLYMSPEETFRTRYKLIIKEMVDTHVPPKLRAKVKTFYKMYWHRQRGVSQTQLLPTYPPTLPASINLDIYFAATQKTRILRDLSHQMLSELAKKMETIHFIPGDAIIKRGSKKCKIIYITYGDVEMLTAEDDSTAILRLTRGTVLTPYGGAVAPALSVSHLAVRAATFCTAHVLKASELWRVVNKHSVSENHSGPILTSFADHIERVKRHYNSKIPVRSVRKSSILQFNRNLMSLQRLMDDRGVPLLASSDIFLEIAGYYIMRNRPDATLTDEPDEICLRPTFPCILQPNSSLLVAWNDLVAFLILCCCVAHPYHLIFANERSLWFMFFDVAVTFVFILDLIVYLSTGANVEEGVPITFAQTSAQQLRSHWFLLDVVATLPIFEFIGDGRFGGINKLLRLPKLFRVLKTIEDSCVYHANVLRFLSYTLLLLIACYLIAAMQQGFMCFQAGYCLVTNLTHSPFWEQKPLDTETITKRLTFGLYWAISMINFTSHRQTWSVNDWDHVIYTLVILEICVILRIFMEAVYSATIMVTSALRENYSSRITMVKNFLIRNEVDPLLMQRFIAYLQLCWHTDTAYNMTHKKGSNIFYDLPEHVYQDIVGKNRSMYILSIPFMRVVNREYLKAVTSSVKLFYSAPNEILLNTGELTNEIYVIKQGICEILDPRTQKAIGTLTCKNHFGGLVCLLRLPAYYTIRAVTHVQVMCIPMKTLTKALANPQIIQAINYVKKTPEFQRLQTPIPSFVKYDLPPPASNLMHFKLLRKHQPDSEFQDPFNKLEYLSILRYVFPRYTIRPDGKYLLRYEWFRFTCALCSMLLYPHYTYLVLQWPYLYYVTLILDLTAYFDIFQRMLIGYFNEKGILVYHPFSTASYYMKGGFITDLFGCLPLENLESVRTDFYKDMLRVTPTKQFLMLNRLIQLYRMPGAMNILRDYIERQDILLVIQAIPLFMAILNIITCFMVFYSVRIYYHETNDGYVWRIEPFEDHGGSWIVLFKDAFRFNLTSTPWNMHLATYFWVVYECSTTGYGVFQPSNHDLIQVLFIGMACTTMVSTYYLVRIISVRANVNKSLAGFKQHMKDIKVYMAREKLDPELHKELQRFYEYNWEKMGGIDYRGVLKLCDQITLRTDAILHIYGPTFTKCPILADADVSLLRIIGRAVRSVYFLRGMTIIEHDDMVTDMYFVNYGGVEVIETKGEMNSVLRLSRGSVFGNLEGTDAHRSPYTVVATSRLHLLMIKSKAFSTVTKDFPAVKENLANARMGSNEMKMYVLGSEAAVMTVHRDAHSVTSQRTKAKTSLVKYIYFQEGMVKFYLIGVCMGCIYLDFYNAGYKVNSMWMLITLYSLDFCFLLKILTRHSLPFLVTNKNMKRIMLQIRRLYFKVEFKYDLISVLPLELFSYATSKEYEWMWFGLLRLNRTFRIATVYRCLRMRNESITVNLTLTTVMAVIIWFTLYVHTTTCIWYFIATVEDSLEPNSSWIYLDNGKTHCDNYYVCSLYFVITTVTHNGVGDIIPKKHSEVLFVVVVMIMSTMAFMIFVGEFSNIMQYQSFRSFSFYSKYLELQAFLKNNRVSDNLVTLVNKYTLHLWRENRGLQIPHFLQESPLSLRLRVMSAAYLHHITRHHIFEDCEPAFLRQVVGCLILYTYNEGMYVVKQSEITDSMYIIHTGKVMETCEGTKVRSRAYPAGSYFGILQGLVRNTPYTHSYQTMIKSQVLTLKLDAWEYLLKHFPRSRDNIYKHMGNLGDKDMDVSWHVHVPENKPLIKTQDATPGPSQGPRTETQYRKVTIDSAKEVTSSDDENQSTLKKEPADSINADTLPVPSAHEEKRATSQLATEEKPNQSIFKQIAETANKIMGRMPESKLMDFTRKDELLFEEDVEATVALLAQFDKARKKEVEQRKLKSDKRVIESREKYFGEEEFTFGVEESVTNATKVNNTETFIMRPLQIRDDEEDTQNSEINQETPGVDVTEDLSNVRNELAKASKSVPPTDIPVTTSPLSDTPSKTKASELVPPADIPVTISPLSDTPSKTKDSELVPPTDISVTTSPLSDTLFKLLDPSSQSLGASQSAHEEKQSTSQITIEEKPNLSFLKQIAEVAKKIMGLVSEPDIVNFTRKDEFLLEEDVEATEALLAQFDKARKKEMEERKLKSDKKVTVSHVKFFGEKDFTFGVEESVTDATEVRNAETFIMRPLQIRDDEEDTQNSEINQETPGVDVTEDLSNVRNDYELAKASKSVPPTNIPVTTSPSSDTPSRFPDPSSQSLRATQSTHDITEPQPAADTTIHLITPELTVYSLESLDKLIEAESGLDMNSKESVTQPSEAVSDKELNTDVTKPSAETLPLSHDPGTSTATDTESKATHAEPKVLDPNVEEDAQFYSSNVSGPSEYDDNLKPAAVHTQDKLIKAESGLDMKSKESVTQPSKAVSDKEPDTDITKPSAETLPLSHDPGTSTATDTESKATNAERKVLLDPNVEEDAQFYSSNVSGPSEYDDNLKPAAVHTQDKLIEAESGLIIKSKKIVSQPSEAISDKTLHADMAEPPAETLLLSHDPGTSTATDTESKATTAESKISFDAIAEQESEFYTTNVSGPSKYDDNLQPVTVHAKAEDSSQLLPLVKETKEKSIRFVQDDRENSENTSPTSVKDNEDVAKKPARVLTLDSDEPVFTATAETNEGEEEGSPASPSGITKKGKKLYKRETMD